jgi:two-component sensor histidine kinase
MRERQHRVTNNLQMITTLIRLEARNLPPEASAEPFTRLAGRVGALAALYRLLSEDAHQHGVDLGVISARSPRR